MFATASVSKPFSKTLNLEDTCDKSDKTASPSEKYGNNENIVFVQEPVNVWENVCDENGKKILNLFYENPKEYAFAFQQMAYITRYSLLRKTVEENKNCKVIICERSLDADRNIFAKMLFDDGIISKVCFQIYNMVYDEFSGGFQIDKCVYIDADPEICSQRIGKRARSGEAGIELDYLAKCKKYHDDWLLGSYTLPLLHLKTNENASYEDGNEDDCGNKWIKQIMEFIGV